MIRSSYVSKRRIEIVVNGLAEVAFLSRIALGTDKIICINEASILCSKIGQRIPAFVLSRLLQCYMIRSFLLNYASSLLL